jgi:regulator of sigma E protease
LLITVVATALVLGILIFIHELGHFLVAKSSGVTVLRFSLGFGPRLFGTKRGDTDYCVSAIPLGGYVKMLGEEPGEELTEEQMARSFTAQSVWKRILIVLAGPMSNFVLAIIVFALLYTFSGIPEPTTEVGSVNQGSPAELAGIHPGDKVLKINGKPVNNWDELSKTIEESDDRPLTLQIERGTEKLAIQVTPKISEVKNLFGEPVRRPLIGISASGKYSTTRVNPAYAAYYSLVQTWTLSKLFFLTVVKLVERAIPLKTLGGPILIAQMVGQQAHEGMINLIYFLALISVNLAVLNLLPIPVLDGGHIMFFVLEAILGKPISVKKMEIAQKTGMIILLVLMVFVFYNDIMRIVLGQGPQVTP